METTQNKPIKNIKPQKRKSSENKFKKSSISEVQVGTTEKRLNRENERRTTEIEMEPIITEPREVKQEQKAEERKKYTIYWFRITRVLLISSLLFVGSFLLYVLAKILNIIVEESEKGNIKFDSIKPSVYATGTSYYKNKEIEKSINICHEGFNKISALSKMDSTNINEYFKLNKERFLLISGLPGIGKTFCVKSIIGEVFGKQRESENWKCIELKPDVLLSKYSGRSEEALTNIFTEIETTRDSKYILIFDECDDLITYPGVRSKVNEADEAPNYGGNLAGNILTGFFLHLISTNDNIVSLPFICIFITNKEVENIAMRVKNKFKTVEIKLTDENIKELINNYMSAPLNNLNITLNPDELTLTLAALKDLSVQRVIEVLQSYAESKSIYNFSDFLLFITKTAEVKRKREDNFNLEDEKY